MDSVMDLEKGIEEETSEKIQRFLDSQINNHNRRNQHTRSIFEVSDDISGPNFQKRIGIGLLNRRPDDDDVKIGYMFDLFESIESPLDDIRNECVNRVCSKLNQITACYGYNLDTMVPNESSQMCTIIVVDACYILSLIYKWSQCLKHKHRSYSDNLLVSLQTKHDLIVLDNQIPFFVLQDIFECTILKIDPRASLVELIIRYLSEIIPFEEYAPIRDIGYKHILDLLYKTYQGPDARSSDTLPGVYVTAYSAVELRKAGVKFKPNYYDETAIKFKSSWGNATLTMPAMRIDESTAPLLWNLTAYERCSPEVGNYIASHNFAMMMLVNTKEDLLKLEESKIVRNLTDHQYIMDLIHDLCKGVALTKFSFAKEWRKMYFYCNSFPGYTRRTYFSGAWSYIASVSALILFILTMIQTYCSIRGL